MQRPPPHDQRITRRERECWKNVTQNSLLVMSVSLQRKQPQESAEIGAFVQSKDFEGRVGFVMTRLLRRIAEADANREADLLSYLFFDGGFAKKLSMLGYEDAKARHEEFCVFLLGLYLGLPTRRFTKGSRSELTINNKPGCHSRDEQLAVAGFGGWHR
jgi:hypothetical protein